MRFEVVVGDEDTIGNAIEALAFSWHANLRLPALTVLGELATQR